MEKNEVGKLIRKACSQLYEQEHLLIKNEAHERDIASHLRAFLKELFKKWSVDSDYNKEGNAKESKRDLEGKLIVPDIIIHNRGSKEGPNLAVIQIKGYWNKENRSKDENDLIRMQNKFNYLYLFRLELNEETFDLIEIN